LNAKDIKQKNTNMKTTGNQYIAEVKLPKSIKSLATAGLLGSGLFGMTVGGAKLAGVGRFAQQPQSSAVENQPAPVVAKQTAPVVQQAKPKQTTQSKAESGIIHHDVIKNLVKQDEGIRTKCYRCTAGKLTVGYGHNLDAPGSLGTFKKVFGPDGESLHRQVRGGKELSKKQADDLFSGDYESHLTQTKKMIPDLEKHSPNVQSVLVSGTYRGHVGDSPNFRKLFNAGNYSAAAKELLDRKELRDPKVARGVRGRMQRDAQIISDIGKSK
jgi:lysozyme